MSPALCLVPLDRDQPDRLAVWMTEPGLCGHALTRSIL